MQYVFLKQNYSSLLYCCCSTCNISVFLHPLQQLQYYNPFSRHPLNMFLDFFLAAEVTCLACYRELKIEGQIGMYFSVQGNDYEHNHVLLYLASRIKTRLERQREKCLKTAKIHKYILN